MEHVRSVLVSHTVSEIIVCVLQVKHTFSEKEEKRNEHGSVKHDSRASNLWNARKIKII